jgi:transposase InsO family protein
VHEGNTGPAMLSDSGVVRSCGAVVRCDHARCAFMAVFDFIEGWHNPRRRHSALGYRSPMNYEKAAEAAA